jgi:hypothetical protein
MRSPLAQYFIRGIGLPLIHQTRIDQRQEYDPVQCLAICGNAYSFQSLEGQPPFGRGRCALAKRLDFPASRQD